MLYTNNKFMQLSMFDDEQMLNAEAQEKGFKDYVEQKLSVYPTKLLCDLDANARAGLQPINENIHNYSKFMIHVTNSWSTELVEPLTIGAKVLAGQTHPILGPLKIYKGRPMIDPEWWAKKAAEQYDNILLMHVCALYARIVGETCDPAIAEEIMASLACDGRLKYWIRVEKHDWRWLTGPRGKVLFDNSRLILTNEIDVHVEIALVRHIYDKVKKFKK